MLLTLRRSLHERFVTWALRSRAPEPVPISLTQRRIYVLPSRPGLLYAVSLLVMLIGAINYNLSLGYALVFLLSGLGVVAILHTFRNLLGLQISPGMTDPVFASETALFPLIISGQSGRERRLLQLVIPGQKAVTVTLPAEGSVQARLPYPATRRGWLSMPRATLETFWPLGLVRAWSYLAPSLVCLVYPQPAAAVPPASTFQGTQGGRLPSDTGDEDFAGLRRHQATDPPHHVAWKAVARQDINAPLQTKQFAGTADQALWFDWGMLSHSLDTETRLSILVRWILDADEAGLAWGLRLPGTEIPQSLGRQHRHACLKALALYDQEG